MPRVRRSNPEGLPPRVYAKHSGYYYVTLAGKWVRLGKDWTLEARTKWAELAGEAAPEGSVSELLTLWRREVLTARPPRTKVDNENSLANLEPVFGRMAVGEVTLPMVRKYLKIRPAKVRGNREVSLLSQIYRWAMNEGYAMANPCEGVIYNQEKPRTRLVRDDELERFLAYARSACPVIAATLRLMYLTAQRRVDLLALRLSALQEDGIEITQSKTGARLLIEWTPELRAAVDECRALRTKFTGLLLICTRDGQAYTESGIKAMFARTMRGALDVERGPPVLAERFRMQDMRPKAVSDVGGGKRGKDLAGHRTQSTTDRVYDRITFKRVKPTR